MGTIQEKEIRGFQLKNNKLVCRSAQLTKRKRRRPRWLRKT